MALTAAARVAGDMFVAVLEADVYLLKHILHDWNDEGCRRILSVVRKAAKSASTILILRMDRARSRRTSFREDRGYCHALHQQRPSAHP